ncbi:Transcription factor bHLH92 [Acorus calamus]|uniref:Transcription factor bHLH92 n=1 Tax=Acorus calamus TaxID=4465 RepID=A0AAV9ELJ9_ACOCL|nr:Transcription factor bHLH92 [Acorus calamus]
MEELNSFTTDMEEDLPYFQDPLEPELLWPLPFDCLDIGAPPDPIGRTAFAPYTSNQQNAGPPTAAPSENIHKRVIGFLSRTTTSNPRPDRMVGTGRSYQHMIQERHRRVKLSQRYADLHAMLPPGSKASKNLIVQGAAAYIHRLEGSKAALQRRNEELTTMMDREKEILVRVSNPSSKIDSMIEALRCLKRMNVRVRTVRSRFDGAELAATVGVETEISGIEVEKAVDRKMKFGVSFHEGSGAPLDDTWLT